MKPMTHLTNILIKRRIHKMRNSIFNYDDGNFIYPTSDNMGVDSEGNLHMRMGDNMSMNLETGELHIISGWNDSADEDDF